MTDATTVPGSFTGALKSSSKDERLAARAADGDERAFATIYRRYHQGLYRYCQAILGDSPDAHDALQNTMVRVLSSLPGERRDIALKPWLYRIAHNESITLLRHRRPTVEIDPEASVGGADPSDQLETRLALRQLTADLAQLPDRQRAALLMKELSGLSCDEIAAALDTSPGVARQTTYEARTALQQMAEGRDMSCDLVKRAISDGDGRTLRRRDLRAHLRACDSCSDFRDGIRQRHDAFGALCPLSAAASVGVLHSVLGGSQGGSTGGLLAAILGGGGQTAAASTALKSAVAVVAVTGAGVAANDAGVIDVGLPGSSAGQAPSRATPGESGGAGAPRTILHSRFSTGVGNGHGASPGDSGRENGGVRKSDQAAGQATSEHPGRAYQPGRPDSAPGQGTLPSSAQGQGAASHPSSAAPPAPAAGRPEAPSRAPQTNAAPVEPSAPTRPAPAPTSLQPATLPVPVAAEPRVQPPERSPAG